MGTTKSNKGTRASGTPYVPSWLDLEIENVSLDTHHNTENIVNKPQEQVKPTPQPADPQRYLGTRTNFTKFVKSGGINKSALKKAISGYVYKTSGGAKQAARKMGSSRTVAAKLFSFLNESLEKGVDNVLKSINLETLKEQSLSEILLAIFDMIAPEGGTIDQGIARDALSQTIVDVFDLKIDIKKLNTKVIKAIIDKYITNAICEKLYNEIGTSTIAQIKKLPDIDKIDAQIKGFIGNAVADASNKVFGNSQKFDQNKIVKITEEIFIQAFTIVSGLGKERSE